MQIDIHQLLSILLLVASLCNFVIGTSREAPHKRRHLKGLDRFPSDRHNRRYDLPCLDVKKTFKSAHHRIAGGYTAKEGEFPSFIGLLGTDRHGTRTVCGGVAISEQLVLTADRCFPEGGRYRISAAPSIWQQLTWEEREVKTYKVVRSCSTSHGDMGGPPVHDYRVLRLDRPIKGIEFAHLPTEKIPDGSHAISVGLGATEEDVGCVMVHGALAESLQVLPVKTVRCKTELFHFHPLRLCFKHYQKQYQGSACPGDSGSPVYGEKKEGRDVVVAITNFIDGPWNEKCNSSRRSTIGTAGVYENLDSILELVKDCSSDP